MKNCNVLYVVSPESFRSDTQLSNTFKPKYLPHRKSCSVYVLLFIICIVSFFLLFVVYCLLLLVYIYFNLCLNISDVFFLLCLFIFVSVVN